MYIIISVCCSSDVINEIKDVLRRPIGWLVFFKNITNNRIIFFIKKTCALVVVCAVVFIDHLSELLNGSFARGH